MLNTIRVENKLTAPSKIVCIGRNYVDHVRELNNEIPDQMVVFIKPNSSITNELRSRHHEPLHYEGEISFVVKDGHFDAVGFGLDLTKREMQDSLKARGLPWERAKAFDGAALFSPFVRIDDIDASLTLQLDINGDTVQNGSIQLMMNKPEKILQELQDFVTLNDGDIVMTGTPKGVGVIKAGDRYHGKIMLYGNILTQQSWSAI